MAWGSRDDSIVPNAKESAKLMKLATAANGFEVTSVEKKKADAQLLEACTEKKGGSRAKGAVMANNLKEKVVEKASGKKKGWFS